MLYELSLVVGKDLLQVVKRWCIVGLDRCGDGGRGGFFRW